MEQHTAYVLLSGGQDSFVSLIWAMRNFQSVEAVSIAYQQQHNKELAYASRIAEKYKVKHFVYNIDNFFRQLTVSSLLGGNDHNQKHQLADALPASFVPNRNGIFLTIIATHAYRYRRYILSRVFAKPTIRDTPIVGITTSAPKHLNFRSASTYRYISTPR